MRIHSKGNLRDDQRLSTWPVSSCRSGYFTDETKSAVHLIMMQRSSGRYHLNLWGSCYKTYCQLMDLGTQGTEQCQALQISVSWINNKVNWDPGRHGIVTHTVSMQERQSSGEHSDGCCSKRDPAHIKENQIFRRIRPRKGFTNWYFFCCFTSVYQIYYRTTLRQSVPETWLLTLTSNLADLYCARRAQHVQ